MTTQDERIATLEADAHIKAANLELVQARVAELEAQNKALYDQMSMMAQYGKPPAQPDHQGHSCTHKCTWPQCEAAQPAPAQEQFPAQWPDGALLTPDERVKRGMPAEFQAAPAQRLSDELIRDAWRQAESLEMVVLRQKYWPKLKEFARAIEAAIVPPGYCVVPVEIVNRFPEINPSNYGPDEVDALNAWGIELAAAAAPKDTL